MFKKPNRRYEGQFHIKEQLAEMEEDELEKNPHIAEYKKARDLILGIIEDKNTTKLPDTTIRKQEKKIAELTAYEKTLYTFLERLGCNTEGIKKIGSRLFEIELDEINDLPKISPPYGFKGGVARELLKKQLGIVDTVDVRDLDIVRTTMFDDEDIDETVFEEQDKEIAETYSPDDFANGYGIEILNKDYFETRDFSVNEVLVVGNKVYASKQAILDIARGIIRFTDFEKQEYWGDDTSHKVTEFKKHFIKDKLLAKALRLIANEIQKERKATLDPESASHYEYLTISDFHIALHLDRAFEQGEDIGIAYIKQCQEKGYMDKNLEPLEAARDFIAHMYTRDGFIFRHVPEDIIDSEREMFAYAM